MNEPRKPDPLMSQEELHAAAKAGRAKKETENVLFCCGVAVACMAVTLILTGMGYAIGGGGGTLAGTGVGILGSMAVCWYLGK